MPQKKRELKPSESLILLDEDRQAMEAPPTTVTSMAAYEPTTFAEVREFAGLLCQSKMVPEHLQGDPGAVMVIMARSRAIDIHWSVGMQEIYLVYGRLSYSANLISAICETDPEFEYFEVVEATDDSATVEAKKRRWSEPRQYTVTMAEANKAGFTDGKHSAVWKSRPKTMLGHMATREAGRLWNKARLMGVYATEELEAQVVDITPTKPPELAPVQQQPGESKADVLVREKKAEEAWGETVSKKIDTALTEAGLEKVTDDSKEVSAKLAEAGQQSAFKAALEAAKAGDAEAIAVLAEAAAVELEKAQEGFSEAAIEAAETAAGEPDKKLVEDAAKGGAEPEERFQDKGTAAKEDESGLMTKEHKDSIYALLTEAGGGDKMTRMYLKGLLTTYLGAAPLFLDFNQGMGYQHLEEVPDELFEKVYAHVKDHIAPKGKQ